MAKVKDFYVNRALVLLTMSAANTLTFQEIRFGVGLFQGIALILHRLDLYPNTATAREVVTAADHLVVGLTTSDEITTLNMDQQSVMFSKSLIAVAATTVPVEAPMSVDLSGLPGGGLIMPANPLYLAMNTSGFAAAGEVRAVLYHTFKELRDSEYLELIQGTLRSNI